MSKVFKSQQGASIFVASQIALVLGVVIYTVSGLVEPVVEPLPTIIPSEQMALGLAEDTTVFNEVMRITNEVLSTTDNACTKGLAWLIQAETLIEHGQNGFPLLNLSIETCPSEKAHFLRGYILLELGNEVAANADFLWVLDNGTNLVEPVKKLINQ